MLAETMPGFVADELFVRCTTYILCYFIQSASGFAYACTPRVRNTQGGGGGNNAEKTGATNKAIEIRTQCPRNRAGSCYIEKLHRSDSPTGFKHFSRVVLSLALCLRRIRHDGLGNADGRRGLIVDGFDSFIFSMLSVGLA